jgi:hypothetical protein
MRVASNPHAPRIQNSCSLFPIFVLRVIQTTGPLVPPTSAMVYFPDMDKDTKDILEAVNFIKDHMVTKTDFDDAVEKLDGRLTAVESKIGGIHNRIDDESLKRGNLENRVRSVVPNLPPPPERV